MLGTRLFWWCYVHPRSDDANLTSLRQCLRARACSELGVDTAQVTLYRVLAEEQRARDPFVGLTCRHQLHNLDFTRGEQRSVRWPLVSFFGHEPLAACA